MEKTQNFKSTVFACYRGYITQGIVNNLSPLFFVLFQNKFGISYSLISALILCNFVTQVITDVLSVKYVDRIGYRKSAVIAHALAFLGLVMQGTLPNVLPAPYVGLVLATIVNGVGGGLIEVIISPIVDYCPGEGLRDEPFTFVLLLGTGRCGAHHDAFAALDRRGSVVYHPDFVVFAAAL